MFLSFDRKRWRFRMVPNLGDRGNCDAPTIRNKEIRINSKLRDEELLEVLIHEFLHCSNWTLDEDHVAQMGEDLSRALWRLGYRKVPEDGKGISEEAR